MNAGSGFAAGDVIDGKYEILRSLGQGAMGCVYEARHELLGDLVAIKCLRNETPSEAAVERFLREARVVRAIHSPHAVKVLEVGLLPNRNPFIVMERLHGDDLESHLQACGALPPVRAAELLIQACDGLAEAHRAGVIHRDLKPENLFLARDPDGLVRLKVLDFGVAKMLDPGAASREMLRTAGPIGTPLFMSPEQIQGGNLDARSDVWAIGILLFHLLSERFPFESPTIEGLAVQICTAPPLSLGGVTSGLPPSLLDLVDACMEKDPGKRPASVYELALRLQPHAPSSVAPLVDRIGRILGGEVATPRPGGEVPASLPAVVSASLPAVGGLPKDAPLSLAQTLPEPGDSSSMAPAAPLAVDHHTAAARPETSRRGLLPLLLLIPVAGLAWRWVQPAPLAPPAAASPVASILPEQEHRPPANPPVLVVNAPPSASSLPAPSGRPASSPPGRPPPAVVHHPPPPVSVSKNPPTSGTKTAPEHPISNPKQSAIQDRK